MILLHRRRPRSAPTGGFALLIVLLVLLALLVLTTPFLLSARNSDRASAHYADRAAARVSLDTAARHGRAQLGASHPSLDTTPWWDSLEEVTVDNAFDGEFLDANDARGLMWDLEVADVSGRIDLDSAGPHVLANIMGVVTRTLEVVEDDATEIEVSSVTGLDPNGFLWLRGELIFYERIEDGKLVDLHRGLGAREDEEGTWIGDGPWPPSRHGAGVNVVDQRAHALPLWRAAVGDGAIRQLEAFGELRSINDFVMADGLGQDAWAALERCATVHGDQGGGRTWQRATRLTGDVEGGLEGTLPVADLHWFNEGATVQVSDGVNSEVHLVLAIDKRKGALRLHDLLRNDYRAFEAEVRVLSRRPVNLNTAAPEVLKALFANLQIRSKNSRITGSEAEQLVGLVVASRPFTGFEDFLRRLVLPAGGIEELPNDASYVPEAFANDTAVIDPWDAVALYRNGLNANDVYLEYSTMPYSFITRDTYAMDLRTSVNAKSGVERVSARRERVELVTPQRELMRLWTHQEDFDESLRLDREAPFWTSGPHSTSRYHGTTVPPSRMWSHMGTWEGKIYVPGINDDDVVPADMESPPTPEHIFASREADGWAQLWPAREDELETRSGRLLHFDHETRDPEGRYLPDQPMRYGTDDDLVQYTAQDAPLLRSLGLSLWIRPRTVSEATVFDLGGTSLESDRVSLLLEGEDLVLRVLDGVGDHPETSQVEAGEVRFALAPGQDPGLPADVWSHVDFSVAGNRPDQLQLMVNGTNHGVRTPGLTRLTGPASQDTGFLSLESGEGFPEMGVARLGNELIEYTLDGDNMSIEHIETGPLAGFGGRLSRERFDLAGFPISLALTQVNHAVGTPVSLYGYSLPLGSDVPMGNASLEAELGLWRVARLAGVENGATSQGDPINVGIWSFGQGLEGASSTVTGLVLSTADYQDEDPSEAMRAFHPDGGYAAIIQISWSTDTTPADTTTVQGTPLGGIEVIRYSGWTGTTLQIAARGDAVGELQNIQGQTAGAVPIGGRRAFIFDWENVPTQDGTLVQSIPNYGTYVVPISLAVPRATELRGYLVAQAGDSQFAQLTHLDQAELTEWVRYDWFEATYGQLVRDAPAALRALYFAILLDADDLRPDGQDLPGAGGGGTGGVGGGGLPGAGEAPPPPLAPPPPGAVLASGPAPGAEPSTTASAAVSGSQWDPYLGELELEPFPISRAASEAFQFRGVLGTQAHIHAAGTQILPVFHVAASGPDTGRAGRMDAAFLVGASFDHPGWPVRVHRAHMPATEYEVHPWDIDETTSEIITGDVLPPLAQDNFRFMDQFVALQAPASEIMLAGTVNGVDLSVVDTRALSRLVLFPSGERPRAVDYMALGQGYSSRAAGSVPSAVIDEVCFQDERLAMNTPLVDGESMRGARLMLASGIDEAGDELFLQPRTVRLALGPYGASKYFLEDLPADAGLLRIGDEILCYEARNPETGLVSIASGGRGLLGTRPGPHEIGEPVHWIEGRRVTVLGGSLAADGGTIQVSDLTGFPLEGTVLIDRELIHYTWHRENALEMPRASGEPGAMDRDGPGIFRGRYGTEPAEHGVGAPVILFPFRYWDRWTEHADGPELAYLGLQAEQKAAWWRSVFWSWEEAAVGGSRLGVLQRSDEGTPWDADPELVPGLDLQWQGVVNDEPLRVASQADRLEWRVFVDYLPGAYDPDTGLSHGWKATPRFSRLGVFFIGPSLVLRSLDR